MKDKFGLRILTEAKEDFDLGKVFGLPKLSELPSNFKLGNPIIKHQGDTDFCSAYTSCGMSEFQEGVELYPAYSFALSKKISGDPDAWGQNLRDAMKAHVKFGAIEKGATDVESRRLPDYPSGLLEIAQKHRKKSYFKVTGKYTPFDNIRASIWRFKAQKQAVALGLVFSWPLSTKMLSGVVDNGFGHAMYAIGWVGDYLTVVNSYGKEAGDQGIHFIHKETINHFTSRYGAYMLIDIPVEEAKLMNERAAHYYSNFFSKLFKKIWKR